MNVDGFLASLRSDAVRLGAAAAPHLDAAVPACPGWTVRDAVMHVAVVYRHKVAVLREGGPPKPWPPDFGDVEPLPHLQASLDALLAEFASRSPSDPAWVWWSADEGTVAFWIRRMAQETAVHRVDVELAAGEATPVDPALAADGVDELLSSLLPGIQQEWPEAFAEVLPARGEVAAVRTGGREWRLRIAPEGIESGEVTPDGAAPDGGQSSAEAPDGGVRGAAVPNRGVSEETRAAVPGLVVSGDPSPVLLWLWGRAPDSAVTLDGDPAVAAQFRRVLVEGTQ